MPTCTFYFEKYYCCVIMYVGHQLVHRLILLTQRQQPQYALLTLGTKGYGSRLVILSTALQRAALTSSRQLRYEQAKHVDGLQSDGWILLKCFRFQVMAGSP